MLLLSTFTVTSSADSGTNTLRWAITGSNAAPGGTNTIKFGIGTGVKTISLQSALPAITVPVLIDGLTQGGAGYAGTPLIVLNGTNTGGYSTGLVIAPSAPGTTVRGLAVTNFGWDGIDVNADNCVLVSDFIGTNAAGNAAAPNYLNGITVTGSNNTIGAVNSLNADGSIAVFRGNVVSDNSSNGIVLQGNNNLVQGNLIGTDVTGRVVQGNYVDGVVVQGGSNNTIGGTTAGAGNVISSNNYGQGVAIVGTAPPAASNYYQTAGTGQLGLTADAFNAGFSISTFARGFPTTSGNIGPLGIVFPVSGGVLVSDQFGKLRLFGSDVDGQTLSASAQIGATQGNANTEGLARVGSTTYMVQSALGLVVQVAANGTLTTIVNVPNAVGLAADPRTGLLYVSDKKDGIIYRVDPVKQTATVFAPLGIVIDGLAVDPSTGILYAAEDDYGVQGFDLNTAKVVFDSGPIAGGTDGIAVGAGELAGSLFVNTNAGTLVQVNVVTHAQATIATGGSRGDFLAVDPTNNTLFITQSDRVLRLFPPEGGGFVGGPKVVTTGNLVVGNKIGTDVTGTVALGNGAYLNGLRTTYLGLSGSGVLIADAAGNTIGGATASARNLISGNALDGVLISGAMAATNRVLGNRIGTDITGGLARANGLDGVALTAGANGNVVDGNLISGNAGAGLDFGPAATGNVATGNLIGTNAAGGSAVANQLDGVLIQGGSSNTIGATTAAAANIISGNARNGVSISDDRSTQNQVLGNRIGTDATGLQPLGNGFNGVQITSAYNAIGGTVAGAGNLISANLGNGVVLNGANDLVAGNFIGTDLTGNLALGNQLNGVLVQGAVNNTIGGGSPFAGNVISGNRQQGVAVLGSSAVPPPPGSTSAGSGPMRLTDAAINAGFSIEPFASNFDHGGSATTGVGPLGITFPSTGGVLVTAATKVRVFSSDTDFQDAGASGASPSYGSSNAIGLARVGSNLYMSFKNADGNGNAGGGVEQIDNNGNYVRTIVNFGTSIVAEGMVVNPVNGHIYVTTGPTGYIFDVNPITRTKTVLVHSPSYDFDGISVSADGRTVYVAEKSVDQIVAYDTATGLNAFPQGNLVFTGGEVVDGTAVGTGALAGNLFVNTNTGTYDHVTGGMIYEVNLNTLQKTLIAYGGTRGDFVAVDPNNGTLLLTQTAEVLRLFPPPGSGFGGGPAGPTSGNVLQGNEIGTNAAGNAAVPNGYCGVFLSGGVASNLIGTDGDGVNDAAERNVISANTYQGIYIGDAGTTQNVVAGNFIGTDATGTARLGNSNGGIWVDNGASSNRVGVLVGDPGAVNEGNVLAANAYSGIAVGGDGSGTSGNTIKGNFIGTDKTGAINLGNGESGVSFYTGAPSNTVGGPGLSANVIAFNGHNGVTVAANSDVHETVRFNRIYANARIGIDLGYDGVTLNGSHGTVGPNGWQKFPSLTAAYANATSTYLLGTSPGTSGTYTIDFYANPTGGLSAFGQGQIYLGSVSATGGAAFQTLLALPTTPGWWVSATATSSAGDTSEFSADLPVLPVTSAQTLTASAGPSTYGQSVRFTATVTGTPTPAGTVQFLVDGQSFGAAVAIDPMTGVATSSAIATLAVGSHTITANYSGDFLRPSISTTITQVVNKAHLMVSADAKSKLYGDAVPALTYSISGFVNGETAALVTGSTTPSASVTATSQAGAYAITITAGTLAASNYDFQTSNGTFTVNKAHLTVTANPATKLYGDPVPALTYGLSGFVNGENASVVSGTASVSTAATSSSPIGPYAITASPGTLSATNYDFPTFIAATLTNNRAHLTVTAQDQTKEARRPAAEGGAQSTDC